MKRGKIICETLKDIRRKIASANEIDYTPCECTHEGDCAGTCPHCEGETRWLEEQLRLRHSLGKAVTIAGLGLGMTALASCTSPDNRNPGESSETQDIPLRDSIEVVKDTLTEPVVADVQELPKDTPVRVTELRVVGMVDMESLDSLKNSPSPTSTTQPETKPEGATTGTDTI